MTAANEDSTKIEAQSGTVDDWEIVESNVKPENVDPELDENDVTGPEVSLEYVSQRNSTKTERVGNWFRKTGVAVAGGTMVGVGIIMIPLPTPFGAVIAGSGMAVLGLEFPAAQRVLDRTCNKVADAIECSLPMDGEEEGEGVKAEVDVCANEKMKEIILVQKRKDSPVKHNLRQFGMMVVPVIRKIGDGIDKEQLERTSENVTKAAVEAKTAVQTQATKFWRHIMVLDKEEDIIMPLLADAISAPTDSQNS